MTNTLQCCAIFLATLMFNLPASADYITRIWLTHPTSDASTLMVNWETDTSGPSRVDYGPAESLGQQRGSDVPVSLHHVEVPFPTDGILHYRVSTGSQCSAIHTVQSYSGDVLRIAAVADWQDRPDLSALLAEIAEQTGVSDGTNDDGTYSRKIEAPTYEPSEVKPEVSELYDDSKTRALVEAIQAADGLSDEERAFLVIAAQRHTVFNFAKIADFYAHADEGLQTLMEDSALVIIDFDRAIELGYVQLTERIAEMVRDEYGE